MRKTIIIICTIIGLLELMVIVAYFSIFNGNISTNNQDWGLFIQIFNGLIMAILTAVNIYIFYKLNITIENKNQERNIKEKIDKVQSVITQLRVNQYEEIRSLITDVKVELMRNVFNPQNIFKLQKKLMEMDQSFLYKSSDLGYDSFLFPVIEDILDKKDIIMNEFKNTENNKIPNYTPLIERITDFLHIVEFYIFGQMLTQKEIESYISKNKDDVDCTIRCINEFAEELANKMNEK
ncbi:MAG: hypothetical protein IJE73_04275 [Muribaculaceae bacterium]|nr:hypothetical protein [Muribaculaceae bacterium]